MKWRWERKIKTQDEGGRSCRKRLYKGEDRLHRYAVIDVCVWGGVEEALLPLVD